MLADLKLRQIAIAVGVPTEAEARAALGAAAGRADLAELRLDYFCEPVKLDRLIGERPLPIIATNRPPREGGRSQQIESTRLALLVRAAQLGAEYVDVEWDAVTPTLLEDLRGAGSRVIVSRHRFDAMPPDFSAWPDQLARLGADVVKVVGTASRPRDVRAVWDVLERATVPIIAIAMGESGQASRVAALRYPYAFLTFAAPGTGQSTAPGQVSLDELLNVFHARTIGPTTDLFGVTGPGELTTPTRALNQALAGARLNSVALPFPPGGGPLVENVAAFIGGPVAGWYLPSGYPTEALRANLPGITVAATAGHVNALRIETGGLAGAWLDAVPDVAGWLAERNH